MNDDASLSEVLCKLILFIYRLTVSHEENQDKIKYLNVRMILDLKLPSSCAL